MLRVTNIKTVDQVMLTRFQTKLNTANYTNKNTVIKKQ